jgi:hypothetical protein
MVKRAFVKNIGIDYSGAATPKQRLRGLRVYSVDGNAPPQEVRSRENTLVHWKRKEIAEWLVDQLWVIWAAVDTMQQLVLGTIGGRIMREKS